MNRKNLQDKLGKLDQKRKLNLGTQMWFKQYSGWTLEAILNHNPGFIKWLIDKNIVELDNEAYNEYIYQLEQQTDQREYRED
jgi:hypothetical protein